VRLIERESYVRLDTSYGKGAATRSHVVVQLFAGDTWGYGEASPLTEFTGETAADVRLAIDEVLSPVVAGRDPFDLAAIHDAMDRAVPGHPSAKAAIDGALLDLAGKLAGVPACHLLGGRSGRPLAFARPIGIMEPERAVAAANELVAAGVRTLKLKIGGGDASSDVERVRAVRRAVGPAVHIRVDGNQGLDFPTAHRVLRALRDCDLLYAEQPLPAWDIDGAAALRRETGVRVAADEGVMTLRDAAALIRRRAADVFVLKLVKMGGAWRARQIAAFADAYHVGCVVVSTFDTQIGGAVCVQLARSLSNAPFAHELTVFSTQPAMARTCHRAEAGVIIPGDDPGIGVTTIAEFDEAFAG